MKLLWSKCKASPIVLADSQQRLGNVLAALFHPETGQLIAFLVGLGKVLSPSDIQSWQGGKIQVSSAEVLVPMDEIQRLKQFGPRACLIQNKWVLSKTGRKLGRVQDFTIDTQHDQLLNIHVARSFLLWTWNQRIFSAEDISEIKEQHIKLRLEPDDPNAKEEVKTSAPLAV